MLDRRKIKMLMLQRGIDTQRELAERLSTREWTLSKTIRGHRKNPWLVKKLARFFRVDPDRLKAA